MMRNDDLLERMIAELENGQSLESIAGKSPSAEDEDKQLLELVHAIRGLDYPKMDPQKANLQKRAVMAELRRQSQAQARQNAVSKKPAAKHTRRWAWAGAFAVLALMVVVTGAAAIWLAGPGSAHRATLVDVTGVVQVASSESETGWVALKDGDVVKEGDHLRSSADSGAALVFFEGSRTVLGENADVVLTTLDGGWNKSLKIAFDQTSGETHHSVIPLRGQKSFFGVETPFGQVNVHGTMFDVSVDENEQAIISVDTGKVQVTSGDAEVYLTSGQTTTARKGLALETPAYQFSVQGQLTSIVGEQWTVAGVQFTVPPTALVLSDFQPGDIILARGRILEDGSYVADRIETAKNDHEKAKLTGEIVAMGSDHWVIGNTTIWLGEETEINGTPEVGDVVSVNFIVLDDQRWLAKEIELLDEDDEPVDATATLEGSETATPEGTMTLTPSLEQTLTLIASETPGPDDENALTDCTGNAEAHPEAITLSERYNVPYEEIMERFCQHYGFGEIDLVYSLSAETGTPVDEIFEMRESGMGWGEIKALLQPKPTKELNPTKEPKPTKVPKEEVIKPTKKPKK